MDTIRDLLENCFGQWKDDVAQVYFRGGRWISRSFGELYGRVAQVAEAVGTLGVEPLQDRVALMLENCPEWTEVYLANASTGVTVVPIDPKLRINEVVHILNDSKSKVLYASAKLKSMADELIGKLPNLKTVVLVSPEGKSDGVGPFLDFNSWVDRVANVTPSWFAKHLPSPDQVASILYTSGTTGTPKGAMLTHRNFCANAASTYHDIPELDKNSSFLMVLPLFHAYSFTANLIMPLYLGAKVGFVRSLRTIVDDLQELKPTVLMTVPLMAEKMYAKIGPQIENSKLAQFLIRVGLKKIVLHKVLKKMGGKLKFFGIGGAPLPRNVFDGFRKFGFPVIEGYGITECSPGVVYGRLKEYHPGYVGRLIHGMEMRLVNQDENGVGELHVRGPNVSMGYFNNPTATAEAFEDGWFKTGDLCEVSKTGLIAIRGRKKAMIVNREGKNIYAEEVEQCIAKDPRIGDVVVIAYTVTGENGERVGAIVSPNPEWEEKDPEVIRRTLYDSVAKHCAEMADYKRPRKIDVRLESLERTSTLKVRRAVYAHALDE